MEQTIEAENDTDLIPIDAETLASLLACAAFARDTISHSFSVSAVSSIEIQRAASSVGLVGVREPTAEEIADPSWSGHAIEGPVTITEITGLMQLSLDLLQDLAGDTPADEGSNEAVAAE